jgi:RNA polymerase sigma-70 factor (ECF subfamily)
MKFPSRSQADGEADFSAFYKHFFPIAVCSLMSMYATNRDTAEEVVQQAMTSMYGTLGGRFTGMSDGKRRAYLMTAARNKFADHWRIHSREVPPGDTEDLLCSSAHEEFEAVHIRDAFERLPDDVREIAVLRYLTCLSNREIAGVLGINVNTVGSRLGKARTLLIDHLSPK